MKWAVPVRIPEISEIAEGERNGTVELLLEASRRQQATIQQQQERIDQLEEAVASLKDEIAMLKGGEGSPEDKAEPAE